MPHATVANLSLPSHKRVDGWACAAAGAVIGIFALVNHPAFAQQATETSGVNEEITIVAPRVVQRKVVGRTTIGAPIEVISLSRPVSYADLDLSTQEGRAELRKRIENTAKAACKELDVMYPDSMFQPIPAEQNCVKNASSQAMEVEAMVTNAASK
jgi:UrcA family protein